MSARSADARAALVRAVTHEVGNLLAAVRLHAQAGDARDGLRRIDAAAMRAGSLVALLTPLIDGDAGHVPPCASAGVLAQVARACAGVGVVPSVRPPAGSHAARALPAVACEAELLHHLLVAGALAAESVGVSARAEDGFVRFELDLAGAPRASRAGGEVLRGAALAHALAESLLGPRGGEARIDRETGGARVALRVPVAPRPS